MNLTRIYLVTNCYGDPNKVYIGKEKSHQKYGREFKHKQKYGYNIEFTFIDQVNGWDKNNWKPLETYWIQQFIAWGFEVLNSRKTGGSGPEFQREESKQKMRKPKPLIFCKKMQKPRTPNFKKGKEHKSYGIIRGPRSKEHNDKIRITHLKPIIQYDLQGNFIKEWSGIVEAEKFINGDIGACCRGKQKTSGGYIFKYKR